MPERDFEKMAEQFVREFQADGHMHLKAPPLTKRNAALMKKVLPNLLRAAATVPEGLEVSLRRVLEAIKAGNGEPLLREYRHTWNPAAHVEVTLAVADVWAIQDALAAAEAARGEAKP